MQKIDDGYFANIDAELVRKIPVVDFLHSALYKNAGTVKQAETPAETPGQSRRCTKSRPSSSVQLPQSKPGRQRCRVVEAETTDQRQHKLSSTTCF